jgi:hypothetical protein
VPSYGLQPTEDATSWRRFFRGADRDTESARDIQFCLATETSDNIAPGVSPEQAAAATRRKFGNSTLIREEIFHMSALRILETIWQDATQRGSAAGTSLRVVGLGPKLSSLIRLIVLLSLLAAPIIGQVGHGDQVPVPAPSALAIRRYQSGNVLWIVTQAWALAVLASLMFTGLSAKMRDWAKKLGRTWLLSLGVYLILFSVFMLIVNLPLSYYAGYIRPHAFGLSNQSAGVWFRNVLKSLVVPSTQFPPFQVPGLIFGFLFVLLLYSFLRKSPKRWWLYAGLALMPLIFFGALIKPVWMDPLSHEYGPLKDKAIESSILELARNAGIDGGRVYEVNMSRVTKTMDATSAGFWGPNAS